MSDLITEAKEFIDQHYSKNHRVASVMRAADGKLYKGISVQGEKMHLCSEWSALTQALMDGADVEEVVAVYRDSDGGYEIFPPCGLCREFLIKYCPQAKVILSETKTMTAIELLPNAYRKK